MNGAATSRAAGCARLRVVRALLRAAALVGLVLVVAACARRSTERVITVERLGEVRVLAPARPDGNVVLLLAEQGGATSALAAAAKQLADDGVLVATIDLPAYLRALDAQGGECLYVVGDLEQLAHQLEREQGFARYRLPVLAGAGDGATFAYAALAQASAATIAGAAGVDPAATLRTRAPLCAGAPATAAGDAGFAYGARADLPGWWRVSHAPGKPVPGEPSAAVEQTGPVAERLVELIDGALGERDDATETAGLTVVEYPSESGCDVLAIVYSGDGGWRDLDKEIGEMLAARGVPVVGVDSLRSFWSAKTPEEMGRDLATLIATYDARWGTKRVLLIGYSFGAGVLPFAIDHLPPDVRARVVQVSLLGVEARADFAIRFTGWLGQEPDEDAALVLPALEQIDPALVQCFYGEEEDGSLCRTPALARTEVVRTAGGHHFDGDYAALAAKIVAGLERRAPGALPPAPAVTASPAP